MKIKIFKSAWPAQNPTQTPIEDEQGQSEEFSENISQLSSDRSEILV